jgi:hypothetical protein
MAKPIKTHFKKLAFLLDTFKGKGLIDSLYIDIDRDHEGKRPKYEYCAVGAAFISAGGKRKILLDEEDGGTDAALYKVLAMPSTVLNEVTQVNDDFYSEREDEHVARLYFMRRYSYERGRGRTRNQALVAATKLTNKAFPEPTECR